LTPRHGRKTNHAMDATGGQFRTRREIGNGRRRHERNESVSRLVERNPRQKTFYLLWQYAQEHQVGVVNDVLGIVVDRDFVGMAISKGFRFLLGSFRDGDGCYGDSVVGIGGLG